MFPLFSKKEEKVTIRFLFDGEQVSKKDIKIIWKVQQRTVTPEEVDILMTHFMIDEKGHYMDEDKAMALLDRVKGKEIEEVTNRFLEALQEASIPKANGNGSSSHSDPGPAETFPNGSTT